MSEILQALASAWQPALPTLRDFLLHLLVAFVLSQPLAWVYVHTHAGMSYSRSFVQSLVVLSLIVTIVMLAIGDSLARAFGLFGALVLIRFRTPIKDTRDAMFLFLAVCIGIAIGVDALLLGAVGTAVSLLVILYLHQVRFGERQGGDGVLRLRMPARPELEARLGEVLRHYCRRASLLHLRDTEADGEFEFSYQLLLRDPAQIAGLVTDVRAIPGAAAVSVLIQEESQEL
jgi:hypothetical protein